MENLSSGKGAYVGDLRRFKLTVPQAAQVLNLDTNKLRKVLEHSALERTYVKSGRRRIRELDGIDILYVRMGKWLKADLRTKMFHRLKNAQAGDLLAQAINIEGLQSLVGFISDTAAKTLWDIKVHQEPDPLVDNAGMIKNAGVEAHRIAALVKGGMKGDEILEDYPNLTVAQVEAAVKYAEAHPKQGRPFPSRTVKSLLRKDGSGNLAHAFAAAEAHDDERVASE